MRSFSSVSFNVVWWGLIRLTGQFRFVPRHRDRAEIRNSDSLFVFSHPPRASSSFCIILQLQNSDCVQCAYGTCTIGFICFPPCIVPLNSHFQCLCSTCTITPKPNEREPRRSNHVQLWNASPPYYPAQRGTEICCAGKEYSSNSITFVLDGAHILYRFPSVAHPPLNRSRLALSPTTIHWYGLHARTTDDHQSTQKWSRIRPTRTIRRHGKQFAEDSWYQSVLHFIFFSMLPVYRYAEVIIFLFFRQAFRLSKRSSPALTRCRRILWSPRTCRWKLFGRSVCITVHHAPFSCTRRICHSLAIICFLCV